MSTTLQVYDGKKYVDCYTAPDATTNQKGDVQLDNTPSGKETTAATPRGVQDALNNSYIRFGESDSSVSFKPKYDDTSHTFEGWYLPDGQTLPLDCIPPGALERFVVCENQNAIFKLTSNDVQIGDVVKDSSSGILYYVKKNITGTIDANNFADYFAEYAGGTALKAVHADSADTATKADSADTATKAHTADMASEAAQSDFAKYLWNHFDSGDNGNEGEAAISIRQPEDNKYYLYFTNNLSSIIDNNRAKDDVPNNSQSFILLDASNASTGSTVAHFIGSSQALITDQTADNAPSTFYITPIVSSSSGDNGVIKASIHSNSSKDDDDYFEWDTTIIEVKTNGTNHFMGYADLATTASSAQKLTTSAGSTTQPVYFKDGKPVKTDYTLEQSVTVNSKLTDTVQIAVSSSEPTDSNVLFWIDTNV